MCATTEELGSERIFLFFPFALNAGLLRANPIAEDLDEAVRTHIVVHFSHMGQMFGTLFCLSPYDLLHVSTAPDVSKTSSCASSHRLAERNTMQAGCGAVWCKLAAVRFGFGVCLVCSVVHAWLYMRDDSLHYRVRSESQ